jgi:hypothetical protein
VKSKRRAFIELVLACLAAIGCGVSWLQAGSTVAVVPVAAGQPSTTSVDYSPPMLTLALLLAAAAGVLAVIAITRLRGST